MSKRLIRRMQWFAALLAGGTLFGGVGFTNQQQVGGGCLGLTTNGLLTAVNGDRVFNCNGFLGGIIDSTFILDCGNGLGTFGSGSTTTTNNGTTSGTQTNNGTTTNNGTNTTNNTTNSGT